MNNKTLMIKQIIRLPEQSTDDTLELTQGVNLIIGKPNTGKSKWLCMLDYLLGDRGKPEDAFGDLAEKYNSIKALVNISGDEFWIERKWKDSGLKTKVLADDKAYSAEEFSQFILEKLDIPLLHFPKGNPYDERNWPPLSWRTLFRHIYRQQKMWNELADKTFESEQHASILQFLGIAEHLYTDKFGELVRARKEKWKLEAIKDQYISILDEISKEIAGEKEFQVALTYDSIGAAITRLKSEIEYSQTKRQSILIDLRSSIRDETNADDLLINLQERWANLLSAREQTAKKLQKLDSRLNELSRYKNTLGNEIKKIERAKRAGAALSILKVTNCPVCDQTISNVQNDEDHCYLCGQEWHSNMTGEERIDTELVRLNEEINEINSLITQIIKEQKHNFTSMRNLNEEINSINEQLRPSQQAASALLPPEISILDMETGRLHERIRQLERIQGILENQSTLSKRIDDLAKQIDNLDSDVRIESSKTTFEYSAELLSSGMIDYLNQLDAKRPNLWNQGRINLKLRERDFSFKIDGVPWSSKLGGTLSLYFLLSYHYGLMKLTNQDECHYPGFLIIDFPPTLQDGSTIHDKENFIVEPFIDLLSQIVSTQAIFTGAAFEELENVNKIKLSNVWV